MGTAALNPRAVRGLNCPSCGAAIVLRGFAWTQTVACESCGAILDARDPNLRILQEAHVRLRVRPLIPLGTRGEWRGAPFEVIGFQQRTITADGMDYSWREYLLFNPYKGFRYLTEYDGHWNDVVPLPGLPYATPTGHTSLPGSASYDGQRFRLFQTAQARTTFVIGEFPWEVRAGDTVQVRDFVAPPRSLSAETTEDETTWSLGTYVDGQSIWRAFGLEGAPPPAVGIYSNQPSPYAGVGAWWRTFALLAALLFVAFVVRFGFARRQTVFEQRYTLAAPFVLLSPDSVTTVAPFVTPRFTIPGGEANVVVETDATLNNEWMFLDMALVNEATGQAYQLGREVGYYSGTDSDGAWHEGKQRDRATVGGVPGGAYVLRVAPSGQPRAGGGGIPYTLRIRRDVPTPTYYLVAFVLLLVPPIFGTYRAAAFEAKRWAESDTGSALTSAIGSGDDDE